METLTKPVKNAHKTTKSTKIAKKPKAAKPRVTTIVSQPAPKVEPEKQTEKPAPKQVVRSFKDLATWQLAQELAVAVYRQGELFPVVEGSVLTCQMTQASVSVCANVAESFSRRGEERDKLFDEAHAALTRLENYFCIAHELGFMNTAQVVDLRKRGSRTYWAMLNLQKINRDWSERHEKQTNL